MVCPSTYHNCINPNTLHLAKGGWIFLIWIPHYVSTFLRRVIIITQNSKIIPWRFGIWSFWVCQTIGLIKECLGKSTHFLESVYFSRYGQSYSIVRFPLLIVPTIILRKTLASCNKIHTCCAFTPEFSIHLDSWFWTESVGPVLFSAEYLICRHVLTDGWMDSRINLGGAG